MDLEGRCVALGPKPKATNEPKSGFAHLRPVSDCMARAVFVRSAVDDESRHARWEFSVGRSRAREAPTHCRHGSGLVSSGMIFSLTLGETPRVLASDARPRLARSLAHTQAAREVTQRSVTWYVHLRMSRSELNKHIGSGIVCCLTTSLSEQKKRRLCKSLLDHTVGPTLSGNIPDVRSATYPPTADRYFLFLK